MNANQSAGEADVVLIGAGIMSATLGTFLKTLEPSLTVAMFETLHDCAQESSDGWNNAGTGHAANCELNYTPRRKSHLWQCAFCSGAERSIGALRWSIWL
jgi:malate dehydrogenase (quinone)